MQLQATSLASIWFLIIVVGFFFAILGKIKFLLSGSCPAIVGYLLDSFSSCWTVVRQLSDMCQMVVKKLSGSCKKVVMQASSRYQAVTRKSQLSKN